MNEAYNRMHAAVAKLENMLAREGLPDLEKKRIAGKIQGVKLAMSYVEDEARIARDS